MAWEVLKEKDVSGAIIALAVVFASIAFIVLGVPIPDWWSQAFLMIIGFFFGASSTAIAFRRVERAYQERIRQLEAELQRRG